MQEITLTVDVNIKIPLPLPEEILGLFREKFTHNNPQYGIQLAMAKGNAAAVRVPKIIYSWKQNNKYFMLPRGTGRYARAVLQAFNYSVRLNDKRVSSDNLIKFHKADTWGLRPHQQKAYEAFNKCEQGVLESPCGGGKTVSGIMEIASKKQPTLVVMHKRDLIKQWNNEINEKFVLEKGEVGVIAEGEFKPNLITLGLVQSLIRMSPQQWHFVQMMYGMVIVDECYVEGSEIVMADGSFKPIERIENWDLVLEGGLVSNKFSRKENGYYEIKTNVGLLKCTKYNPCLVVNRKFNKHKNCYERFTTNDVVRKLAKDVKKGDVFYSKVTYPHKEIVYETDIHDFIGPEVLAIILADGSIGRYRIKVSVTKQRKIKLCKKHLSIWKYSINSRGDHIFWLNSKDLVFEHIMLLVPDLVGKKSGKLYVPAGVFRMHYDYIVRFTNTLVECDGTKYENIWKYYTTSLRFCKDLMYLFKRQGAKVTYCTKKNETSVTYCMSISIKDRPGLFSSDMQYHLVHVLKDPVWVNKEVTVHDFTTETHRLIVDNMIHSNCHHCPAETYLQVLSKMPAKYRYGLTATPERKDKLEFLLFDYVGPVAYKIDDKMLEAQHITMSAQVERILTFFYYNYSSGSAYTFMINAMVKDDDRNAIILNSVIKDVQAGNFVLVLSDRVKHCKYLSEMLTQRNLATRLLIGMKSGEEREQIRQECLAGNIDVVIGTTVADEGMDIPNLNSIHLTCPSNNEPKLKQRVGRVKRNIAGKLTPTVYDYVDHKIDKCCKMWWNREKWYSQWGFNLRYKKGKEDER